jgi:cation diffusion facilitator CzcD-associated flavoprotein CzcO
MEVLNQTPDHGYRSHGTPNTIKSKEWKHFPPDFAQLRIQTGHDFEAGKKVVGFGNSACEIAIDLCEQGADPAMAVRSPVNVVPRDLLGIQYFASVYYCPGFQPV